MVEDISRNINEISILGDYILRVIVVLVVVSEKFDEFVLGLFL